MPKYYKDPNDPYEAIKVIEAYELGFNLGNAIKYILRAGKKPGETKASDLRKALYYVDRELKTEEKP